MSSICRRVSSTLVHPVFIGVGSITAVLMVQIIARFSTVREIPLNRFATKNSYAAALSHSLDGIEANLEDRQRYKPTQVVGLFRHGIRYPSKNDIIRVGQILSHFQSLNVSQSILDKLQSVTDVFPLSRAGQLAPAGALEHQGIGQRFGRNYSDLFQRATENDISFLTSSSPRANASAVNFKNSFQAELGYENISFPFAERNDLLRFFDYCPKYIDYVEDNDTALDEFRNFSTAIHHRILEQIAHQLDLPHLNVTEKQLFSMFQFGAIEVAVLGTTHWSSLLSPESILALEYASDLQEYWIMGYGYPINYEISCPLVSDMFHHFDNQVNGNQYKTGVFYFGHAETVVPVLAALGLFNDGFPLRAADFGNNSTANRKFRVSHISSFSANIALVLHEFQGGAVLERGNGEGLSSPERGNGEGLSSHVGERYMLELLVNERPLKFPFADRILWPYSEVRRRYEEYIVKCSFERNV